MLEQQNPGFLGWWWGAGALRSLLAQFSHLCFPGGQAWSRVLGLQPCF